MRGRKLGMPDLVYTLFDSDSPATIGQLWLRAQELEPRPPREKLVRTVRRMASWHHLCVHHDEHGDVYKPTNAGRNHYEQRWRDHSSTQT